MQGKLYVTLMSMKNGKSPRLDAFPCEFHNSIWDCIREDFYCLAAKIFCFGCLIETLNQGLTKLIPKNGARDAIGR